MGSNLNNIYSACAKVSRLAFSPLTSLTVKQHFYSPVVLTSKCEPYAVSCFPTNNETVPNCKATTSDG